jgi:hypothetical protein
MTSIQNILQTSAAQPASRAKDDPRADDPNTIMRLLHQTAQLACSRYDRALRAQLPGMTLGRCAVIIHLRSVNSSRGQAGKLAALKSLPFSFPPMGIKSRRRPSRNGRKFGGEGAPGPRTADRVGRRMTDFVYAIVGGDVGGGKS